LKFKQAKEKTIVSKKFLYNKRLKKLIIQTIRTTFRNGNPRIFKENKKIKLGIVKNSLKDRKLHKLVIKKFQSIIKETKGLKFTPEIIRGGNKNEKEYLILTAKVPLDSLGLSGYMYETFFVKIDGFTDKKGNHHFTIHYEAQYKNGARLDQKPYHNGLTIWIKAIDGKLEVITAEFQTYKVSSKKGVRK
jgi:hypothetical protein